MLFKATFLTYEPTSKSLLSNKRKLNDSSILSESFDFIFDDEELIV